MKNVTISLDEDTAAVARLEAARNGLSVSRWIGDLLRRHIAESTDYEAAMRGYLQAPPFKSKSGTRLPRRDELHDRPGLR